MKLPGFQLDAMTDHELVLAAQAHCDNDERDDDFDIDYLIVLAEHATLPKVKHRILTMTPGDCD